jgi:hypothetical protein
LKALRRLGRQDRERISTAIGALPKGDVKLLRSPERLWRLRVGGWRVIFDRLDAERVIDRAWPFGREAAHTTASLTPVYMKARRGSGVSHLP